MATRLRNGNEAHPLYPTWSGMRARCNNPNSKDYKYYGGKGIRVCQEWNSFAAFVKDMGPRPDGCTLDRINGDLDYSPSNCRWATKVQQMQNRSNSRIKLEEGAVGELSKSIGLSSTGIVARVKRGWPLAAAISTPKYGRR